MMIVKDSMELYETYAKNNEKPIKQCCANCEQGKPWKNKVREVHRILCTPFLTPWMREWIEREHPAEDLMTEFMKPTDGAGCDCFIPKGGDKPVSTNPIKLEDTRGLNDAVNECCTCGGNVPSDGCPACNLYHLIKDWPR